MPLFAAPPDSRPPGLVVLDRAGRIRFVNERATGALGHGSFLRQRRGRMHAADPAARDSLAGLLGDTFAECARGAVVSPRVLALPRPGRLPVVALAMPVPGADDYDLGAVVLLTDPEEVELPPVALVRTVFGLSAAEAAVALGLLAGRSLQQIADERRTSLNTVRTLLVRAFAKTGCRRQSELVRVLGALNNLQAAAGGLLAGLALAAPRHAALFEASAAQRLRDLLRVKLAPPNDQRATVNVREFRPGECTGYHFHGCGHEIVCVLGGTLTMAYSRSASSATIAGEAVYVAPGMVHNGFNSSAGETLALFHIGIGPGGSIDRREV